MRTTRRGLPLLPLSVAIFFSAALAAAESNAPPQRLPAGRGDPKEFGVQDETVTAVTAASFTAISTGTGGGLDVGTPIDLATLGRHCTDCATDGVIYFTTLNIPAGAVIDFIG